ncbi:murein L,D-transpeptidase [Ferruginibacter yonginensis]|uniref:Murein L,D-transpeptidase n=1 Tax=Ferruginibacter yonginensis TaxID=1310416 RepID=A0ABV8QUQ5_9BACT
MCEFRFENITSCNNITDIMNPLSKLLLSFLLITTVGTVACKCKKLPPKENIVINPNEMNVAVQQQIKNLLEDVTDSIVQLSDSTTLNYYQVLQHIYAKNDYAPIWSNKEKWQPQVPALLRYIDQAALQGLFKNDYSFTKIMQLKNRLDADSVQRTNAVLWANADLLISDALATILKDLKQGRLVPDSISYKKDTSTYTSFFLINFNKIIAGSPVDTVLAYVQPQLADYKLLKNSIKQFVDSMDTKSYTFLNYPYKDSLAFLQQFKKRMAEANMPIATPTDSTALANTVKKYQQLKGLTVDGKIGNAVVKQLNLTDAYKFKTLAVTLDKYKMLPEKLPTKYIWVNLPSYNLKVWDTDTLVFESKVICGKPTTPTPLLNSAITDIIIYPTWTVPTSIITKDMLPGLKRNPNYLARKGMYLLNNKGERINPENINWSKYTKGIPYLIQQGSGDDNALGVIKFNFSNPFSVYLHDTNQRYLFKNGMRSLSHGCVRVQEWQKLANYIVRNDSMLLPKGDTLRYNTDSISNWIAAKQKHRIDVKNKIPLFIKYFSCENLKGSLKFYDDIYGEDKKLIQKYFANK